MQTPLTEILAGNGVQCYRVGPDTRVTDAVRQMNQRCIGSLLVVDAGRLVGIFTERDVLVRIVDAGRDPLVTSVAEVMTPNPVTIVPEATVEDALRTLSRHGCRHLPVVGNGRILGVVSVGRLTRWLVRDQEHEIGDLLGYISGDHGRQSVVA